MAAEHAAPTTASPAAAPDVARASDAADLLLVNVRARSADPRRPWADAVWCRGTLVHALGPSAALRKRAPAGALVVDGGGADVTEVFSDRPVLLAKGALATFLVRGAGRVERGVFLPEPGNPSPDGDTA